MRDRDDRALVLGEEALEPGDRLGVEVVRRLVEQQQVRRATSSSRQSATRRRSPPESVVTSRSPSGSRSASIARSSVASSVQASRRSICSCTVALLGEQRVEVGVRLGELRRDRVEAVEQVAQLAHAVLDVAAHVLAPGRARAPARAGRRSRRARARATPLDGSSRPAMIRSSVDLPAPFGPSTPIFAPGRNDSEMFASTCRSGP